MPESAAAFPSHVSLHPLGDRGILLDAWRQRIYETDTAATLLWCCLEEDGRPEQAARILEARAGLPAAAAEALVARTLGEWRQLGLLDPPPPPPPPPSAAAAVGPAPSPELAEAWSDQSPAAFRCYRLLDTTIRVGYATIDLARRLHGPLRRLAAPRPGPAQAELRVVPVEGGYEIRAGGAVIDRSEHASGILPMLKTSLADLALRRSRDLCALHAAALSRDGRALVLPGVSGSGKSTLSVALATAGFGYLADDTLVLGRQPLLVRPLGFAPALKSGSWRLLRRQAPDLGQLPIHRRADGRRVRYLATGPQWRMPAPPPDLPAGWLVFPELRPGAAAALVPLPPIEAARRLLPVCFSLTGRLEAAGLERILRWLEGLPCHSLRFSELDEAVALLEDHCR